MSFFTCKSCGQDQDEHIHTIRFDGQNIWTCPTDVELYGSSDWVLGKLDLENGCQLLRVSSSPIDDGQYHSHPNEKIVYKYWDYEIEDDWKYVEYPFQEFMQKINELLGADYL